MSLGSAIAALALLACREPTSHDPEVLAQACSVTEPARIVAAPPGFVAAPDAWYGLHVLGDDLLFTFDRLDDPRRTYWRLDRCTGELAPFPSLAPGLHNPYAITTDAGRIAYANDALGTHYLVDRLDIAGDDEPRPVPGLPEQLGGLQWGLSELPFVLHVERHASEHGAYAAGIGGATHTLYRHDGDPDVPAVALGEFVQQVRIDGDDTRRHVLRDDGELHRLDLLTGDSERLLTGVRHFHPLAQPDRMIWQELGDDLAETIYVHDFATGDDLALAVNDFTQKSWWRDPEEGDLGGVQPSADGSLLALPGPGRVLVALVRTADAEAFTIPEHRRFLGFRDLQVILLTEEAPERVLALWDPIGGRLREWYRGPQVTVALRRVDGDQVEYFEADPGGSAVGTLWRVDLTTGARERLLTRSTAAPAALADGRYFLAFERRQLAGPPLSGSSYLGAAARDLKLVDPATGLYTTIADDVTAYASLADDGLVYFAPQGPEPGVWVHPIAWN
ncbi:hypothetical protein [Nannocystis bainbridge]|uniref:Lipoprotein n=1 Tax=Nannocystis bainbridge TaxID=2995303 RepID=A0ABT5DVP3_9BACT|nr:hypothetical protein [Nannocystis bainbridge]MDC0717215.1 hypothetical protein [Nannocystis bainbridge]